VNLGRSRGSALTVGLIVLTLVTLLGIAGASSAHVDRLLAQNEAFRENAAFAASAGIEMAISAILASTDPATVEPVVNGRMPGSQDAFEARVRFAGYESLLPQVPGARVAGAHFEIVSTGRSARRAMDRQSAGVMWVVAATEEMAAADCEPLTPRHCFQRGELLRLSWQRLPGK
jgi:type II secretory pathway component PulK